MVAKATQESIRAIMRRKSPSDKLNILTFCTHERYEQQLCRTGHNFFSITYGKKWDTDYGEMPSNYYPIDNVPEHIDYDIVLCHTTCERLKISQNIKNEFQSLKENNGGYAMESFVLHEWECVNQKFWIEEYPHLKEIINTR